MLKEVKLLKAKALNSLILSAEHFNSPFDTGRVEATLIFMDHSFEMLLKAAILHKGGKIRDKGSSQTIGFDDCLRKALSDGQIKFLENEDVIGIQTINTLRDAAQHHLLNISEQHLYIQTQLGLSQFKRIYENVFGEKLYNELPRRVLPLSTQPPVDINTIYKNEIEEVKSLLSPGKRKVSEVVARLRSLAITEGSIQGNKVQPTDSQLKKIANEVKTGKNWEAIFPGVASISFTTKGYGPSFDLRITNKGIPVHLVPEGTPGATVVGIRKINILDFYNLSLTQVASKINITMPKTRALILINKINKDDECFKEIKIGKSTYKRYSQKTIDKLQDIISKRGFSINKFWNEVKDKL